MKEIAEIKICNSPNLSELEESINRFLALGMTFHGPMLRFGDGPYIQTMARMRESFVVPQKRRVNV